MKIFKHLVIILLSMFLQIIESREISLDNHHGTMLLAMIFAINTFVFVFQIIYFVTICVRQFYYFWMDFIFYLIISIITGYLLYNLVSLKYTLFNYFLFSLLIELLIKIHKNIKHEN